MSNSRRLNRSNHSASAGPREIFTRTLRLTCTRSSSRLPCPPVPCTARASLATLQELEHLDVGFVSLTEALDLTTPAGRAMAALLAVFAEFEREILRERVRAGLAHARQNDRRLGRPITAALHANQIHKLHRSGVSKSEISRRLSIGRTSVRRILAAQPKQK